MKRKGKKYDPHAKWVRKHPFLTRFEVDLTPLSCRIFKTETFFLIGSRLLFPKSQKRSKKKFFFSIVNFCFAQKKKVPRCRELIFQLVRSKKQKKKKIFFFLLTFFFWTNFFLTFFFVKTLRL